MWLCCLRVHFSHSNPVFGNFCTNNYQLPTLFENTKEKEVVNGSNEAKLRRLTGGLFRHSQMWLPTKTVSAVKKVNFAESDSSKLLARATTGLKGSSLFFSLKAQRTFPSWDHFHKTFEFPKENTISMNNIASIRNGLGRQFLTA